MASWDDVRIYFHEKGSLCTDCGFLKRVGSDVDCLLLEGNDEADEPELCPGCPQEDDDD